LAPNGDRTVTDTGPKFGLPIEYVAPN